MKNIKEEFYKFQSWLKDHMENYVEILSEKPYCLHISRDHISDHDVIMFKYDQIESDFSNPFVKLCRGLILDDKTFNVISFPFVKFHNYSEPLADEIDWSSCWTSQKLDGSLIKVSFVGDELLISTNGTIDAYKANIVEQIGCKAKSFGELVDIAILDAYKKAYPDDNVCNPITVYNWFYYLFERGKTYMFELTSPFNKVVVTWHETKLNFLGLRDNSTLQETYFSDSELKNYFNTPKVFPLTSVEECVKAAEQLDCNNEGYVVCDRNFNRVKIKSPLYVSLHHLKNNGILSYERGIEIVRTNELDEVLTYFPEFAEHLNKIKEDYSKLIGDLEMSWSTYKLGEITLGFPTRKDSALWITKNFRIPGVGFALLDNKVKTVKEWADGCPPRNMVKFLGYKE